MFPRYVFRVLRHLKRSPEETPRSASQGGSPAGSSSVKSLGFRLGRAVLALAAIAALGWAVWSVVRWSGEHAAHAPQFAEEEADESPPEQWGPAYSSNPTVADLKQASQAAANELLAAYPDAADAWNVAAQLEFHLGNTPEAVRLWQRCIEADPRAGEAHYGLGYIAHLEGDNVKAVERFRAALEVRPDDPRIPLLLAESLARSGKPEEAVALLVEHLKTGKGNLGGLVLLGQIYLDQREYDKARWAFEQAVQFDPTSREAQFGLATAWARLGEAEKSKQAMKKFQAMVAGRRAESTARVMSFDDVTKAREVAVLIHSDAAKVYAAHGDSKKAEEMWRKTAALDPRNVPSRVELLAIYERAGRNRAALRVCEELRDLEPKHADHWLNYGILLSRLGRRDAALAALDQAIALEPSNAKYQQARQIVLNSP